MEKLNREEAFELLKEYIENENLIKHALAVEAAMRAYAQKYGEDEEKWGITGLLHDLDYERYPDMARHSARAAEILKEKGYPEDVVYAIHAHNDAHGLERNIRLAKVLYGVDELTGFIVAVALVRPNKKLEEVELKSIKKKFKDKAFARQVNREEISRGAKDLGEDPDAHITLVLEAMKKISGALGL